MASLLDHEIMRNQTAAFSGNTAAGPLRVNRAPGPLGLAVLAALVAGPLLLAGCGKRSEAKVTGSRSDPPISLACAWQPGYTYHLRLDTEILTETEGADPQNSGVHRVTYGQECIVRVTNSLRGGNLDLDVEITSVEMERAKNEAVALSFNSEQGGESIDDMGYVPVLKKLVGGRLRFSVSSSGRLVRFEGIPEWLNNALGNKSTPRPTTSPRLKTLTRPNSPGTPGGPTTFEVVSEDVASGRVPSLPGQPLTNATRVMVVGTNRSFNSVPAIPSRPAGSSASGAADTVGRTLRGFFNTDLFRTLLEFRFLPAAPVRVGDEWKEQGDTPITSRTTRVKYNAQCTFKGWQQRGSTNCARIDAVGKTAAQTPPGKASKKAGRKSGVDGTVWVNTELAFPAATMLDKESVLPGDTNTRMVGTNSITTTTGPKYAREHLTITLLKVTPPQPPAASSDASP
jgi:hypothetical protein